MAALIWLLPCVYLYISYETNIYHNECTHMVSPQCVFPGVLYNSCIGIISLHCVLFGVPPSILSGWYLCHRGYTDMSYHQSVFSHDIQNSFSEYYYPLLWISMYIFKLLSSPKILVLHVLIGFLLFMNVLMSHIWQTFIIWLILC